MTPSSVRSRRIPSGDDTGGGRPGRKDIDQVSEPKDVSMMTKGHEKGTRLLRSLSQNPSLFCNFSLLILRIGWRASLDGSAIQASVLALLNVIV
jgi:hypothetical protein